MGHAQRELGGQAPNQASTPTGPVPATTGGQVPHKGTQPIRSRVTLVVTDSSPAESLRYDWDTDS